MSEAELRRDLKTSVHALANAAGVILANWSALSERLVGIPNVAEIAADIETAGLKLASELNRMRELLADR